MILIGTYDEDHSEEAYLIQGLRLLVDFEPILESDVMEVVVVHREGWVTWPCSSNERLEKGPRSHAIESPMGSSRVIAIGLG